MGIVNQGEPSNRVALSISLKRPSNQNESLHHPSMCRSRLRWRRYVWHEEDAKNMGRTLSYGIMLRRKRDEDIFAQNEQGKPTTKPGSPNPTCSGTTTSSSR